TMLPKDRRLHPSEARACFVRWKEMTLVKIEQLLLGRVRDLACFLEDTLRARDVAARGMTRDEVTEREDREAFRADLARKDDRDLEIANRFFPLAVDREGDPAVHRERGFEHAIARAPELLERGVVRGDGSREIARRTPCVAHVTVERPIVVHAI